MKALCKECVVERCRVLRLKNQLNEDYKTVSNLLKTTVKGYVAQYALLTINRLKKLTGKQLIVH